MNGHIHSSGASPTIIITPPAPPEVVHSDSLKQSTSQPAGQQAPAGFLFSGLILFRRRHSGDRLSRKRAGLVSGHQSQDERTGDGAMMLAHESSRSLAETQTHRRSVFFSRSPKQALEERRIQRPRLRVREMRVGYATRMHSSYAFPSGAGRASVMKVTGVASFRKLSRTEAPRSSPERTFAPERFMDRRNSMSRLKLESKREPTGRDARSFSRAGWKITLGSRS